MIGGWLDENKTRPRTYHAYKETLTKFRATLAQINLDLDGDVDTVSLVAQRFASFSETPEREIAPSTFNHRLAVLSSFYTYARKHRAIKENPIDLVKRKKVQAYANATPLDQSYVNECMSRIDRSTAQGMRDYAILGVLLQTGRRVTEVASLQWKHLTLKGARLTLTFDNCKGGKTMRDTVPAPLSQAILAWLHKQYGADLARLDKEAPLWVNFARNEYGGAPLSTQAIADICEKRLGVSKVHTTRHTYTHGMIKAGATMNEIQARLGHETLVPTSRYAAALESDENRHADTLAAMFGLNKE